MTIRRVHATDTAGWDLYFVVFRDDDGRAFDWADNTWKTLSACTTPGIVMAQLVAFGTSLAKYAGDLDMSLVNPSTDQIPVSVIMFKRAGGSQDPAEADSAIQEDVESFVIANGDQLVTFGPLGTGFKVVCTIDTTTTSGDNAHLKVQLLDSAGQLIDLATVDPSATCSVNVQRDGAINQFVLSTTDFGPPNANGWFEADYPNPDWTPDCGYTGLATIVSGGVSYIGLENLNIWP